MTKVTPDDTASHFIGSGALSWEWWQIVSMEGIDFIDTCADDWRVFVTVEEYGAFEFNHQVLTRAIRKIAAKEGKNIEFLPERVRKECHKFVFGNLDDVDFDAGDADCVMQVAVFGKVVFG